MLRLLSFDRTAIASASLATLLLTSPALVTPTFAQPTPGTPGAASPQAANSGWTDEQIVSLVQKYGSATTFAALAVDIDQLDPNHVAAAVRRVVALTPDEDAQVSQGVAHLATELKKAGLREGLLLASVHPQRYVDVVAVFRLDANVDLNAAKTLLETTPLQALDQGKLEDGMLVLRSGQAQDDVAAPPLAGVDSVREAFAAGDDAPIRGSLFFAPDLRRAMGELAFALSDEHAVEGAKLLANEVEFASVSLNPGDSMSLDATMRFKSPAGAKKGLELAKFGAQRLRAALAGQQDLQFDEETLVAIEKWLEPQIAAESNDLALRRSLADETTATLFRDMIAPAVAAAREQANHATVTNKFKQIALAFHNFYDTYTFFPLAGNQKKNGMSSGLSWRVHLLPFLEQDALYKKFKLDEPWNSPNNLALVDQMPDIYRVDSSVPVGKTTVLLPMGEGYGFSGEEPTRMFDITDGTSNTIMFVQAAPSEAVTWTKPEDLDVDLSKIAHQVGAEGAKIFVAARFDGSVQTISKQAPPDVLQPFFTRAGGEVANEAMLYPRPAQPDALKGAPNLQKLKSLGIAFHNYHDTFGKLPLAGKQRQDGKANGLSWRVHLLPFMEQNELYQKFKLDEPWDSEHNKPLIDQMPEIYNLDPKAPKGKTVALLPLGEGYGFSGEAPASFIAFTDGTSNTILVVQASPGEAVEWTKPDDLQVDLSKFADQLGAVGEKSFLALMFDGAVRKLPENISRETLKAAFTRGGGEAVQLP